jgi:hypothetical protein
VQFVVRGEVNNFMAPGYEPAANLEALMVEVYDRLQGWIPTGLTYLTMAFKVYRQYTPQAMPMWDEGRGVWMMSAEFRCEAGAPALVP